jgi:hypothetical protein
VSQGGFYISFCPSKSPMGYIRYATTVGILCLDGDGSFRANRGSETIRTVGE